MVEVLEVTGTADSVKIIGKAALPNGKHLKIETTPDGEELADVEADTDSTIHVSVTIVKTPYNP